MFVVCWSFFSAFRAQHGTDTSSGEQTRLSDQIRLELHDSLSSQTTQLGEQQLAFRDCADDSHAVVWLQRGEAASVGVHSARNVLRWHLRHCTGSNFASACRRSQQARYQYTRFSAFLFILIF